MNSLLAPVRMIRQEALVAASVAEAWRAWSTSEGAREFFAPQANIALEVGGPYEIFFDPADETQGTKGLKLLSYAPLEMISLVARLDHGAQESRTPLRIGADRLEQG